MTVKYTWLTKNREISPAGRGHRQDGRIRHQSKAAPSFARKMEVEENKRAKTLEELQKECLKIERDGERKEAERLQELKRERGKDTAKGRKTMR